MGKDCSGSSFNCIWIVSRAESMATLQKSALKDFKSLGYILFFFLGILLAACGSTETRDNPTQGSIRIAVDEAYRPVMEALTSAYEGIYPRTSFEIDYLPEQKAILSLLQDSVRMAFVTRKLDSREEEMLLQQASTAKTHRIAIDGIALVTSDANGGSSLSMDELSALLKGTIKNWEQLKSGKGSGPIRLVFDDANSSNLLYFTRRFGLSDFNGLNIYVAGSHKDVVDYVKQNPRSIGFIGMNWISDGKEVEAVRLSENLNVLGIRIDSSGTSRTVYPFQEDLSNGDYPLSRELYAITREAYSGLGGGLLTYIARDVGGLIIMKMGLVPVVPYDRNLILTTE